MIWEKIGEGRFFSAPNGGPRQYRFPIRDWGFGVKELIGAFVARQASGNNARLLVEVEDGAVQDPNTFTTPIAVIATTAVTAAANADLPNTVKRATSGANILPYFVVSITVTANTGTTEEFVEGGLYIGGRPN